jgi:hypothetical protein
LSLSGAVVLYKWKKIPHQEISSILQFEIEYLCDIRHICKPSEVWCPDCHEGICTECREHHSLSKPSRNHTTIPIEEYQTLPSYVLEIKEHCDEHHERFNLYCKEHDRPYCRICNLENHKDCKNVAIMEEIIKNVKTSTMFTDIEHLIKEMIENISVWYSSIGIVVWFREGFAKLWCSMHSVQIPSWQSGHQTSDGLEIWRISHIPQKDGELDMMLISWNV